MEKKHFSWIGVCQPQFNASKVVDVDFNGDLSWEQLSNDDGCFFELSNCQDFPENTVGVLLDLDVGSIEVCVNGRRLPGYPAGSVTGPVVLMVEKAELKSVRCLDPAGSECTAASSRDRGKQASNGSDEESNGSDEESDGSDDSERLVAIMQALERKAAKTGGSPARPGNEIYQTVTLGWEEYII
jgi:hypothetical protein